MFGIQSLIIKLAIIVAVAIAAICIATTAGCGSVNGALAQKNIDDSVESQDDNSQDNAINAAQGESTVELIEARAKERERVILAQGQFREMEIRAEQEKWRIFAYAGAIIGGVVVLFLLISFIAYLMKSPLDRYRKV